MIRSIASEYKFYYIRNQENQPVITVCVIIRDKTVVARGISILGNGDHFEKTEGRNKAFGRAISALEHHTNKFPIKRSDVLNKCVELGYTQSAHKGEYMPTSTLNMEQKLINVAEAA